MNDACSEQRKRTAPAMSSGSPKRPSGVFAEHQLLHLLRDHLGQPGVDVAGRHHVRPHPAVAELARERLREADDPGLRGRVVRLPGVPVHPDDAGDVHDRARAALHHPARCRAAGVEDTGEIRLDHDVPILVGHPREQTVPRHAGVVDEDVELAGRVDESLRLLRRRRRPPGRRVHLPRERPLRPRPCPSDS